MKSIPKTGLKGLAQNWRNDLIAALSVSLVALPLCLGVAIASGAPPMAGIISSVIGGIVTTIYRGSYVVINGPEAGLIAVILASFSLLNDGTGNTFNYILAVFIVSGAIQIILGLFRLGKFAEIFPSSVIQGILASIGIIICTKQFHVALGTSSNASNTFGEIADIFHQIHELNPFVTIISFIGILLLVFHAKISYKLFHFLPAPIWVLAASIPFVYAFNFFELHSINFLGKDFELGPYLLINLPSNPIEGIVFPNFSKINTGPFWLSVISVTLISSLASLASSKAVDKLDPYKRRTNLNKDLIGLGASTMVSGAIGGLPVSSVIVRSSVNIQNNAKTKWSNFFHGVLIVIFVLILAPVFQKIPLAALAAILVFTGFKLAGPSVFKKAFSQGIEQLFFFLSTIIITLYTDILIGIFGGIAITLFVHMLLAKEPVLSFFKMSFKSGSEVIKQNNGNYEIRIKGIANFLASLSINKLLKNIPLGSKVNIDMSDARLVDLTVMENVIEFKRMMENEGGEVIISGFENHVSSTSHNRALKIQTDPITRKLSSRQIRLQTIAKENNWTFRSEVDWDTSYLKNFHFFENRPIEKKSNCIKGYNDDDKTNWEIADIIFDEGALVSTEVYNTTVQIIHLNKSIPKFTIEKEGIFDKIFDRVLAFSGQKDINFKLYPNFSSKFLVKGRNEKVIKAFLNKELIDFLQNNDVHHIESNGNAIMIFNYLRLARADECLKMVEFSKELVKRIK